jgi:hypothetical protein
MDYVNNLSEVFITVGITYIFIPYPPSPEKENIFLPCDEYARFAPPAPFLVLFFLLSIYYTF